MAIALLGALTLAVAAAPASAAPDVFTVSVNGSGVVDWDGATVRHDGKPLTGQKLAMRGTTRAGIATNIVCTIYHGGPELLGNYVTFSITVNCVGGVPRYLESRQNIARHIAAGSYVIEPGSYSQCPAPNAAILACVSVAPCYQAGANYDGYAVLMGVDEFGYQHWASVYAPPRWVGCVI